MVGELTIPGGIAAILLVSGQQPWWSSIYDPATGKSFSIEATKAWWPSATRLADGRVLVVGDLLDGDIRPARGGTLAPGVSTVEIFR